MEYNSTRRDGGERRLLKSALGIVAVLAVASVFTAHGCFGRLKQVSIIPPPPPAPGTVPPPGASLEMSTAKAAAGVAAPKTGLAAEVLSASARQVRKWISESSDRPATERTLLEKLFEAERTRNAKLALDTIERLRQRPAMADLDEPLARRLGTLNLQWLLSDQPSPWTTVVTVRRGDSYHRIAREHGTTTAAILALNRIRANESPRTGRKLRVLEFPRAAIVIHAQTKIADVSLNGKFFKRYYASVGANAKPASYLVTREVGPRTRFKELGIVFSPTDLDEIAMLLPPAATIAITRP